MKMKRKMFFLITVLAILVINIVLPSNLYATDIIPSIIENTDNTEENNNTNTENTADNNTEVNEPVLNTDNNTSDTNSANNTTLPQTGVSDNIAVIALILLASISAIYAYKKIRDYNKID